MDTDGSNVHRDHLRFGLAAPIAGVVLFAAIMALMFWFSDVSINA